MKPYYLAAALLLLGLIAPAVGAIELPPPPVGYTWKEIGDLQSAFLIPPGWHFKETRVKETLAYFIKPAK